MSLDLYLLATQGQFSKTGKITLPSGYFIIEEQIVSVNEGNGGNVIWGAPYPKTESKDKLKKKIKLKFFQNDKLSFEKEIIVEDVDLKIYDIKMIEKDKKIIVKLKNGSKQETQKIDI